MTSPRKRTANRLNAARSTGPKTPVGKRAASGNALRHGLRSPSPVLPGEDAREWEGYLNSFIDDLRPVGAFEAESVALIASITWRRRRVMLCEVAAAASPPDADPNAPPRFGFVDPTLMRRWQTNLDDAERAAGNGRRVLALVVGLSAAADGDRLAARDALHLLAAAAQSLPSDPPPFEDPHDSPIAAADPSSDPVSLFESEEFLSDLGVPVGYLDRPDEWDGWTAGAVRRGVERLAAVVGWDLDRVFAALGSVDVAGLERRAAEARAKLEPVAVADLGRRVVPPETVLAAILRYEPHLSRELARAVDQLEKARALRRG